jgi:methionyl-tRNA formyltransferase
MRIVTLGSDHGHPLTLAALAVVDSLEGVEHVDHITARDEREFLRRPRSAAFREHIASLRPDVLLSAAYARIVPEDVLALPSIGSINVHPSLLPDYRGLNAIWWAIYEAQPRVGITVHEMTPGVDEGPILGQASIEVTPETRPGAVWNSLGDLARPVLEQTLSTIRDSGRIQGVPQPPGGSYRRQPQREATRLELDWEQPARELVRRHGIFPGAGNVALGRWRVHALEVEEHTPTTRPPGKILKRRPRAVHVATGDGSSVRLTLARPLRSWVKLLIHQGSTGSFRTLPPATSRRTAAD